MLSQYFFIDLILLHHCRTRKMQKHEHGISFYAPSCRFTVYPIIEKYTIDNGIMPITLSDFIESNHIVLDEDNK